MLAKEIRVYNQEQTHHLDYGGEETRTQETQNQRTMKFRFHKA